jgi:methionine-rich copper-binding protein CopC
MRRTAPGALAVTASLLLVAATAFHLEPTASHPAADGVLEEAPTEVWLEFSVVPDAERTSFSVRGPDGEVPLGEITRGEGDDARILRADVTGPMPAGRYTVSWVGAPPDDHVVRGRFGFTVADVGAGRR